MRADLDGLRAIKQRLPQTRLNERARFARELDRLFARRMRGPDFDTAVAALGLAIDKSIAKIEALKSLPLKTGVDLSLPIAAHRQEVLDALAKHQVLVLCGATGSGKTTQLPKLCLESGRGTLGLIGHTQPRRIAARALAVRIAEELGTSVGSAVGYQVRFNDRTGPDCRVKLMTDGILLKELESDKLLLKYDTLIIDEAHERSLNIDLLLGVLKRVLAERADLKLIVTSATIDPQKFAAFFGGAPIIEVSGQSYPVEIRYRALDADEEEAELTLPEGVVEAVKDLGRARGDILVFLPGEKQIRDCNEALTRAKFDRTEILPLYSRLSTRDQERIFEGHAQRRIVLATNVAETSLTVPGIRNVIDSGLARISRYSVRGKVQRLPIEKIAQASAEQRKGRCGREAEGICIRLFSEEDFLNRDEFTPPEVLRTNLASVILRLAVLGLGEPGEFPFIDPPDTRLINDGYRLLQELKAVDDDRNVTALGRQIASLPVDPRLARMLIAASHHVCLREMLIIASFLEIQDPRERPADAQTQADQAHAEFADARSDFVAVLNLWQAHQAQSETASKSQLRKWCRDHFLSFMRMREWQELHRQLTESVDEIELRLNQVEADYANLHQAVLTGFLGNIGTLDEKREYLGARGTRFTIAPGTPLANKPPKWVVAGNIVETTRVFARMVAGVEPQWIERAGEHLLKRSYAEPDWIESKGFVAALESISLYGLTLVGQRRVNYGSVAPREAREIFIREALVEGRTEFGAPFLTHNRELRNQVEALEAKIRRRDVLVDEQTLCNFYSKRLPEHIHSIAALQKWLKESGQKAHADALQMKIADLARRETHEITAEQYPDTAVVRGNRLALTYFFAPGAPNDGVTLTVPRPLLDALDAAELDWIVPAWRLEKLTAILRALPKDIRKHFVPVPDAAARCHKELGAHISNAAVAAWIAKESGQPCSSEELASLTFPGHLRVNLRVVDLDGCFVNEGRDLSLLKRSSRQSGESNLAAQRGAVHRSWEFGDLPDIRSVERQGVKFAVYPALRCQDDGVVIEECGSLEEAIRQHRRGLVRLAMLAMPQQVKLARNLFSERRELVLLSQTFGGRLPLADAFVERAFDRCFVAEADSLPRTKPGFDALLDARRASIGATIETLAGQVIEILSGARTVRQQMRELNAPTFKASIQDVDAQLSALLPDDFLRSIPDPWFGYLPRYLRAIERRLVKLKGNVPRDVELQKEIAPFADAVRKLGRETRVQTEIDKLRWMVEEFRVSLFAQDLKTAIPVSKKRLADQLDKAGKEALTS